jgi:hypothetical protein
MMQGESNASEKTKKREAYFLEYAAKMRQAVKIPLMVTGGFRTRAAMLDALNSGDCDVVGLARPLCVDVNLPKQLIEGTIESAPRWEEKLGFLRGLHNIEMVRLANAWGVQGWFCLQLIRMGAGLQPDTTMSPFGCLFKYVGNETRTAKAMHKARAQQN